MKAKAVFSNAMQMLRWLPFLGIVVGVGLFCVAVPVVHAGSPGAAAFVYIGTYTGPKSQGIYLARFDGETGRLSVPELAATPPNPTFLALDASGKYLYAAEEISNYGSKHEGAVAAYRIEPGSGRLTLLNEQASGGGGPCHLALDRSGKCLLVANYGSGSVAALPVRQDGSLDASTGTVQHHGSSVDAQRQDGPHAHFITPDPGNRFALACDLGLDKVLVYRLDLGRCSLTPNDPPSVSLKPGSGPRHLAFHPNGRWVFVLNEMASTLTVLAYNAGRGAFDPPVQTLSTLPDGFSGNSSGAEIQVHPLGKVVYASNRGHDSIAVFEADAGTGQLKCVQHQSTQGKTPRHFRLDPAGRWLIAENQDSDNISVFRIDANNGRLSPTGQQVSVGSPVCLQFLDPK